tara:strand:+ start:1849 stop:2304 length:456 start_codon:yes stop_codon:yes gene_type:complete
MMSETSYGDLASTQSVREPTRGDSIIVSEYDYAMQLSGHVLDKIKSAELKSHFMRSVKPGDVVWFATKSNKLMRSKIVGSAIFVGNKRICEETFDHFVNLHRISNINNIKKHGKLKWNVMWLFKNAVPCVPREYKMPKQGSVCRRIFKGWL